MKSKNIASLVIYDSEFGNTAQVARTISSALGAFGNSQALHVSKANPKKLEGIDILVVGSPTQKWRPTPLTRKFLESLPNIQGMSGAGFDTRFERMRLFTGSAARGIIKVLKKRGAFVLLPAESFFVKGMKGPLKNGELERSAVWAREIIEKHNTRKSL